jgi:RHS repeat-associated protein
MPTGAKIKMFYDPLGRVVKTINPDQSQQWVMRGIPTSLATPIDPVTLNGIENFTPTPWESYTYDANDLADAVGLASHAPSTDWNTPKNAVVDCLGRTVQTNEFFDNTDYTNTIQMNYSYDVRGNLVLVKDPYNRTVFEHKYDLRTPGKDQPLPPIWSKHIDKGESTILFDALGKPIEGIDAKGAHTLSAYDVLQRPNNAWAKNKTGDSFTLRNFIQYGDSSSLTSPEDQNLKGKVYRNYDEAGRIETPEYDFKGNLLSKIRKVIDSTELKTAMSSYNNYIVNWTSLPAILDAADYQSDMSYDALNRIMELELPLDLNSERKKIIPTYNKAGALEKVDLYSSTGPTTTNYVENIVYNAKGQRLLIAFGNARMTRYAYDAQTFRLLRQRTEGYSKSTVGSTITYTYTGGTNKQDDGFNYDLVGNILNIFIRVTDCGIDPEDNELDRTFEYDPIYRLTYADGRESNTQSGNSYLYTDAPTPTTPLADHVNSYERNYTYDKLGNISSVVQSGTNGFTRNFVYNSGKNTLQKIAYPPTPTTIESYTYDDCGNTLTTNTNRHYIWNHADQLLCYKNQVGAGTPTVFTQYDYAGQDRVSKMVRTGTTYERTIYIDGVFEYVNRQTISTTYEKNYIHIMDDKSRIAEVRINVGTAFPGDISDNIVYILEDQIGSSVVRLSTSGTVIDEEEYYPFGDSSLRTFTYKRYRYVGKEKDSESGLYYYGARYYAAWTCRFISVDPLANGYPFYTPYNYAGNKPIHKIDIDGMQEQGKAPENKSAEGSDSGNKARPGSGANIKRTERTRDYFNNMTATSTEKGYDGVNNWTSKTGENGETVVESTPKDNPSIGTVWYGFDTLTAGTAIEIAGSETIKTEKTGGDIEEKVEDKKNEKKPDKFNGVDIVKGATVSGSGVFGAVLSLGTTSQEGQITDRNDDIGKIVKGAKKAGDIKEIEITIVGSISSEWRNDQKAHFEGTLGSANYNLQKAFDTKLKGTKIKATIMPNKIEQDGNTRTIIRFK